MNVYIATLSASEVFRIYNGKQKIDFRKLLPKKFELPAKFIIYVQRKKPKMVNHRRINNDELFISDGQLKYGSSFGNCIVLNKKIIGEFECKSVDQYEVSFCNEQEHGDEYFKNIETGKIVRSNDFTERKDWENYKIEGISISDFRNYMHRGIRSLFGISILNPQFYKEPKEISDFNMKMPPQMITFLGKQ